MGMSLSKSGSRVLSPSPSALGFHAFGLGFLAFGSGILSPSVWGSSPSVWDSFAFGSGIPRLRLWDSFAFGSGIPRLRLSASLPSALGFHAFGSFVWGS